MKKSTDDNSSMKNYPASKELKVNKITPFFYHENETNYFANVIWLDCNFCYSTNLQSFVIVTRCLAMTGDQCSILWSYPTRTSRYSMSLDKR